MNKLNKFLEKVKKVHGNNIDMSKVEYVNSQTKVCLICHKKDKNGIEHGEYWQTPSACVRGDKCPKCANENRGCKKEDRMTTEKYKIEERKIHGDKYDLSKVEYVNANTKICIICPEHGEFWQLPYSHLKGQGCPKCAGRGLDRNEIIERLKKIHNNKYDYSKSDFKKSKDKICIICPEHGEFWQELHKHMCGQGCPECGNKKKNEDKKITFNTFVEKANKMHNGYYQYKEQVIDNAHDKIEIICPKHGMFVQNIYDHLDGHGCPKCGFNASKAEDEIYDFINNGLNVTDIQQRCKNIIPKYEIDLYFSSYGIGIEYNGLLWHSEKFGKDKNYHLSKLNECNKKGIKLIQIFEDEYVYHKEIVLSKIRHLFNKDNNLQKVYARKCIVQEITKTEAENFLNTNHIQGYVPSSIYLGAFYNNKLVGVMTFRKEDKTNNNWELNRFATDITLHCIGLGGKLFNYFIKNYSPSQIKSFADRRWTLDKDDNLYLKLGFKLDKILKPDYSYVTKKGKREHKFNFRKELMIKRFPEFNLTMDMSENAMANTIGMYKIWDCGKFRYVWSK